MSQEYAMSRVRDALEASGGNTPKAQRLLLSWIENDKTLLAGLVAPHMMGIITHALTFAQKQTAIVKEASGGAPKAQPSNKEIAAALIEGLSSEDNSRGFGNLGYQGKPGKTSQEHIDTINRIARKISEDE